MNYQVILSGMILIVFAACIFAKALVLRRRGIRAIVQGPPEKGDFILPVFVIALLYSVLARPLGLPMWDVLVRPFWESSGPGLAGLVLCVLALIGFILSLISFGDSFRVGIDKKTSPELITGGMFAISRNPLYLCFLMFLAGMFLIHHNLLIVIAAFFFAMMIHRQILREESFLKKHSGGEYAAYCEKVHRYLGNNNKLALIKLVHTAIWCVFVIVILYILYAGIFNKVNPMVWFCIVLVIIEGIVLLIFKGKCPFTILGYKYTDNPKTGFDIFLPVWLAKYNKIIFSVIFAIGFILILLRVCVN